MFGRKKSKSPSVIAKTFGGIRTVATDCDYKEIYEVIKTISKEEWDKDTEARNSKSKEGGNINLDVRALMIKFKSSASTGPGFKNYEKNDSEIMNKLKPYLDKIISQVKDFYGYENLKLTNVLFTELKRGGHIPEHVDSGQMLTTNHRLHIPIYTDPAVKFTLDHVDHYLEPGNAYEINNQILHEVKNDSNIDRIHMMIDLKEWKDNEEQQFYEVDSQKY